MLISSVLFGVSCQNFPGSFMKIPHMIIFIFVLYIIHVKNEYFYAYVKIHTIYTQISYVICTFIHINVHKCIYIIYISRSSWTSWLEGCHPGSRRSRRTIGATDASTRRINATATAASPSTWYTTCKRIIWGGWKKSLNQLKKKKTRINQEKT